MNAFRIGGAMVGMLAALIVLELPSSSDTPPTAGRIISECDGAIRELVIHYVAGDTIALPVYQGFLPQLAADVTVHVLCPDQSAFDELAKCIGPTRCRLSPIITHHPITVWSRDRWIATQSPMALLTSAAEDGAETWPQRAGDSKAAFDIAAALPDITARRLGLFFDGGDLLADDRTVFVTPAVVARNLGRTVQSADDLISLLHRALGKRIVLLHDVPDHHAGMFMMAAGNRTMLVGDPRLAQPLISESAPPLPGGPDFSSQTQRHFDAAAEQAVAAGYRVVRIPVVPSHDGKTFLTYVNVITDHTGNARTVYMPTYRGADAINAAAADVWRSLGYEVRAVDCTSCYSHFGTLHCLVNVLRRA